eukprot:scaffold48167_cov68-Phaeocystis_antarctica.AAC.1
MQRGVQWAPRPHSAARVPLRSTGRGDEDKLGALLQLLLDLLRVALAHGGEEMLGLLRVLVEVPQPLARALLIAATACREPLPRGAPAFLRVSRLGRELVWDATLAAPVFLLGV